MNALPIDAICCSDALAFTRSLPDDSVNCIITSPPYYGLRDYGVDGQMGSEETPQAYITRLIELFRECRRVLRPDGTCWINMGDSYATDGRRGPNSGGKHIDHHGFDNVQHRSTIGNGFKPKDLMMMPARLAIGLQDDGWYLREDIIWEKPNIMPETMKDRPTKSHEYVYLLSKSEIYFFNQDSIREPQTGKTHSRGKGTGHKQHQADRSNTRNNASYNQSLTTYINVPGGRNSRSIWSIPTEKIRYEHFAAFPQVLVAKMILAGCAEGGIVFDPFMGTGTTAIVAKRLNCHYVGCELNPKYIEIADKRMLDTDTYKISIPLRSDCTKRYPGMVIQPSLFEARP